MVMVNDRRRRTCPSCRADLTTDEGIWRCDWDGRHCTRCYEPLSERRCPLVHDAVTHAWDADEAARVAAVRARYAPEPQHTSRPVRRPAATTSRPAKPAEVPTLARWIARKVAR